jgi:threonine dehydratase
MDTGVSRAAACDLAVLATSITSARTRGRQWTRQTPLVPATARDLRAESIYYKCENLQRTGSFKFRGALNKVLSLTAQQRESVVTASTGNHALAVAEALSIVGGRATVVVPATAPVAKIQRLIDRGFRLVRTEGDPLNAELTAREIAAREGGVYISPYNDIDVIAGQGTVGLELLEQLPQLEVVYISVGGGGLISGAAAAIKAVRPEVRVVACFPENATAMFESMQAGGDCRVADRATLSDATAGNLEAGAITIDLCRKLVDDCVLVSEQDIADGVRDLALQNQMVVEGAAGVAVSGCRRYLELHPEYAHAVSAVVLCGGHIDPRTLAAIINHDFDVMAR